MEKTDSLLGGLFPTASVGLFVPGAEQLPVQRAAAEKQLVEGRFDVLEIQASRADPLQVELRRPPHQLLDERRR